MTRAERAAHAFALAALLLLSIPVAFRRIACVDLPWQLAAGHEILDTGRVPTIDRWTRLTAGRPWLDVHWLAQAAMAALERAGGLVGLQVATVALLIATLLATRRLAGEAGKMLWPPLAIIAVLGSWQRVEPRPDALSFLFPTLFLVALEGVADAPSRRRRAGAMAVVAGLSALWTNVHGSFVLGVFLSGLALVAAVIHPGERKGAAALAAAFAITTLATLLNPRGFAVWRLFTPYVGAIATRFGGAEAPAPPIQEWLPPLTTAAAPYLMSERPYYLALLALSALALAAGGRGLRLSRAFALLFFAALSLTALRNIPPFAFLAAAIVPSALASLVDRLGERRRAFVAIALGFGSGVVAVALAGAFASNRYAIAHMLPAETGPGFHPTVFPERPAGWIEAAGIAGQAFHNYDIGGYWIWRFDRRRLALIDGRADLLAPDALERYVRAMAVPEEFEALASELGVTHLLISYTAADARILVPHLERFGSRWRRAHADGSGAVYLPEGVTVPSVTPAARTEHPLDAAARRWWSRVEPLQRRLPLETLNLAILEELAGYRSRAAQLYESALAQYPGVASWHVRLVVLHWSVGDSEAALRHLDWLERLAPGDRALPPLRQLTGRRANGVESR